jgi:hypothetical protein
MANTIPAELNNTIIAQSALEQFVKILAPLNAFSTSFNDEAAGRGDQIEILNLANQSNASNFSAATGYSVGDTNSSKTTVNLSQHKFTSWHITDTERSKSSAIELQNFGYQMGGDLASAVFNDILSNITVAKGFTSKVSGVAASAFGIDDVADLRSNAVSAGLPIDQTAMVLSPSYFGNLIQDTVVGSALNYGGSEAVRSGKIPGLYGIPAIYESNAGGLASVIDGGFLAHPSALAIGMRYLEPQNAKEYTAVRRISDPETGIVMGYREYYEPSMGRLNAVLECVYGVGVGRPEALIRLTSGSA